MLSDKALLCCLEGHSCCRRYTYAQLSLLHFVFLEEALCKGSKLMHPAALALTNAEMHEFGNLPNHTTDYEANLFEL